MKKKDGLKFKNPKNRRPFPPERKSCIREDKKKNSVANRIPMWLQDRSFESKRQRIVEREEGGAGVFPRNLSRVGSP